MNSMWGHSVWAACCAPDASAVATTLPGLTGRVAVPTMLRVHEDVGEAARFFIRTVEAKEASVDHAGFALAARNGIGEPTRRATSRGTAVRLIGLVHAFARAQLSTKAAALVDVGCVDDQRATQCAQPPGSDQGSGKRASVHQNCPRQTSENPSRLALIVGPDARASPSTTGRRR
jgi:hypothetical protein